MNSYEIIKNIFKNEKYIKEILDSKISQRKSTGYQSSDSLVKAIKRSASYASQVPSKSKSIYNNYSSSLYQLKEKYDDDFKTNCFNTDENKNFNFRRFDTEVKNRSLPGENHKKTLNTKKSKIYPWREVLLNNTLSKSCRNSVTWANETLTSDGLSISNKNLKSTTNYRDQLLKSSKISNSLCDGFRIEDSRTSSISIKEKINKDLPLEKLRRSFKELLLHTEKNKNHKLTCRSNILGCSQIGKNSNSNEGSDIHVDEWTSYSLRETSLPNIPLRGKDARIKQNKRIPLKCNDTQRTNIDKKSLFMNELSTVFCTTTNGEKIPTPTNRLLHSSSSKNSRNETILNNKATICKSKYINSLGNIRIEREKLKKLNQPLFKEEQRIDSTLNNSTKQNPIYLSKQMEDDYISTDLLQHEETDNFSEDSSWTAYSRKNSFFCFDISQKDIARKNTILKNNRKFDVEMKSKIVNHGKKILNDSQRNQETRIENKKNTQEINYDVSFGSNLSCKNQNVNISGKRNMLNINTARNNNLNQQYILSKSQFLKETERITIANINNIPEQFKQNSKNQRPCSASDFECIQNNCSSKTGLSSLKLKLASLSSSDSKSESNESVVIEQSVRVSISSKEI